MFWHSCFFLFAKKRKRATAVARESFFFKRKGVLLCDQKYQKSFKRAFLPLKKHLPRARVSRASHAWRVRAAKDKAKVGGFALRAISAIPRVRTYHTKKPSRFVHALSARPHNRVGGREWSMCADGNIVKNFCLP